MSIILLVFCRLYDIPIGLSAGASVELSSSSSLSASKCCGAGDFWREALRFPSWRRDEAYPSEGGVAGLDLVVEDAVREKGAFEYGTVDVLLEAFEGRGAAFFSLGTLSRRIVGAAFATLNFLFAKIFIIRNVT